MNYFIGGTTWDKNDKFDEFVRDGIWKNGWEESKYQDIFLKISEGDMFALKSTFQKDGHSYLRIKKIGIVTQKQSNSTIKVSWTDTEQFDLTNIRWYANALEQITDNAHIERIFGDTLRKYNMQKYINLLKTNKNLILTGAPGTGKTYLAKEIAMAMKAETEFVQFHPSYDYTDFVEGLRPVKKDGDADIGFMLQDGIFKKFCKEALNGWNDWKKSFDNKWKELIEKVEKSSPLQIGKRGYGVTDSKSPNEKSLKFSARDTSSQYSHTITKENVYARCKGEPARPSRAEQEYMDQVVDYMKKELELKEYKDFFQKDFVFIIDEINRAEISKVFGELFFSIDPGYRGEQGKVKTQYANLQEDGDVFKKGFFVPENVYIIGTMNDIDRSVESMDFAMRRRFAWQEIKAQDRLSMWDGKIDIWKDAKDAAKQKLEALNEKIETIQGLGSAYHIGPSYFLKLENYNGNFEQLWNNHLQGVLFEYLRGMPDSEENLKNLKNAYDNPEENNNNAQDTQNNG